MRLFDIRHSSRNAYYALRLTGSLFHSSTVKFASCAVNQAPCRYKDMKLLAAFVIAIALSTTVGARTPRSAPRSERRDTAATQRKVACPSCERNSQGRIRRSSAARREFQREHPCPSTGSTAGPCPGYVVDHIVPLKRGGADDPSNMQWQGIAEATAKDRSEYARRSRIRKRMLALCSPRSIPRRSFNGYVRPFTSSTGKG
jgi:hypothetical protein